jgi:hypothetical protein
VHEDDRSTPFQLVDQGRARNAASTSGKGSAATPPKRSGAFLNELCRQFVHAAGKVASGGIIAHMDARR